VDKAIKLINFETGETTLALVHKPEPKVYKEEDAEGEEGEEPAPEEEEEEEEKPGPHEAKVNSLAFNHDSTLLASCSEDGILKIWEVATGAEKMTEAVSQTTKEGVERIPLYAVAFSGDGTRLLSGGKERCIRIWDPARFDALRGPDKQLPIPPEPEEGWPEGEEPVPQSVPGDPVLLLGHDAPVLNMSFSPKVPNRFASCSTDATIRIWDLESDDHSATLTQTIDAIQCLSTFAVWSPDAATLVASSEDIYVQMFSAVSGKPRAEPLKGHSATVRSAAWAPAAQSFVTCADDNTVRMWHFLINRNITEIAELEGEQMVFNHDMREWGELLAVIRAEYRDYSKGLTDYKPSIYKLRAALDEGVVRTKSYVDREKLLGLEVTDYFELDGMIDDFAPYYQLWHTVIQFQQKELDWLSEPISSLNSTDIETLLDQWFKDVYKMIKAFDNNNMRPVQKIAKELRQGIDDFKTRFPFLRAFGTESVLDRHWTQMFQRMGIEPMAEFSQINLQMMLDANVNEFHNDFDVLSTAAGKQHGLKKAMAFMKRDWDPHEFGTNERNGVPLLQGIDDIQTVLDDHISKTQAIRSSPFCKPFEAEVHKWEATLMYIQDFIDQTIALQRSWMALEPIFVSDDIKRQLPQESENFARIDQTFRMRMKQVDDTRNCIKISQIENIVEDMTESNTTIEKVQKGLKDYFEQAMLSILAETKDPTPVQPHMGKAFEGIAQVHFDKWNRIIEVMISAEGELVELFTHINVLKLGNASAIERWLSRWRNP